MDLSEYERRMWTEIEARLVRERRRSRPLRRAARVAARIAVGTAAAFALLLVAALAGDAAVVALSVLWSPETFALLAMCGVAALVLRRTRPHRS